MLGFVVGLFEKRRNTSEDDEWSQSSTTLHNLVGLSLGFCTKGLRPFHLKNDHCQTEVCYFLGISHGVDLYVKFVLRGIL